MLKILLKNPLTLYLKWLYTFCKFYFKKNNTKIYYGAEVTNSDLSDNVHIYENSKIINSHIGEYSYISEGSHIANSTIGRYCSIGPNVRTGPGKHPTDRLSTSPVFYSKKSQVGIHLGIQSFVENEKISIESDVWIGANATILDGVKISLGTIVAANSVVTNSFPPYSIIGGIPAKFIRSRFNEPTEKILIESKWWDLPLLLADKKLSELLLQTKKARS